MVDLLAVVRAALLAVSRVASKVVPMGDVMVAQLVDSMAALMAVQ